MTRTLVLQLGRLGDVVQATPLLSELAAAGGAVDVLVLRSTHAALLGFAAVANIITIPDSLKPLDDAISCSFPLGKIPIEAHELLSDLQLPLYDRIINASHAPLGCWLTSEIPCANPGNRFGGVIIDRECLYFGAANVYRVALLQFRELNLFNLVDLIRATPGVVPPHARPRLYVSRSAELPFALPSGRLVALNPGASESIRCWPAENFARLAESLAKVGFVPILVGAPSDREACEKVAASTRGTTPNFAGRTTISEMAALLAKCELLVSADTGGAHVAAAVGTTVLGLYGATAWFAETAPYGENHLILQTALNAPMSAISHNSVFAAAMNRLGQLSRSDLHSELRREKQLAWETSIESPRSSDPLGGLSYRPIHDHDRAFQTAATHDESFARCLREAFATEFLNSAGRPDVSQIEERQVERIEPQPASDPLIEILNRMHAVATRCVESIRKGIVSDENRTAAAALIDAGNKIRAIASDPAWKPLSPVIHKLDWQLRMLPRQDPAETFRSHAQACVSAARILKNAFAIRRRHAEEKESDANVSDSVDLKEVATKGEKEGGQVPRSVRIQAPARQRGSVSP